jgi:hypothetical protein
LRHAETGLLYASKASALANIECRNLMNAIMKIRSLLPFLAVMWSTCSGASQFYVFPVNEIEGVSLNVAPEKRPLIDARVRALFTEPVQSAILAVFDKEIVRAFPESSVHARQVRDATKGKYQYIESPVCGEGYTTPVERSYAAVIGLTRASWYQVERDGGRVEILVPITLNLQLVKPDLSKVVYTISETLYSPFIFGKEEVGTSAMTSKVADLVIKGVNSQITSLVETLKSNFKPKDIPINLVGREQGVLITDQGFEVGFKPDEELQGTSQKNGGQALFRVVSVDSGYAALKLIHGSADKGDSFVFTFESSADDSRKPRVMPVVNMRPEGQSASIVADLFSKNIGFKASFQLAPVDVNFSDTMVTIRRAASCVPWNKYPSTEQVFESRHDNPNYFLKFNIAKSPIVRQSGLGAVKTMDSFMTSVTAQVVDKSGNVIFSEIGTDRYNLEKTAGQGLSIGSAEEISVKNATATLANRFIENVRFENGNFKVSSVDKASFTVDALSVPSGTDVAYEILRPLGTKVNGKSTFLRIAVDKGGQEPASSSNRTTFSYSKVELAPDTGDLVRVLNMPRPGQSRISECVTNFRGATSIAADYLNPLIRHASYRSSKFQPGLVETNFFDDANALLRAGFFKLQLTAPAATDQCMKSGYSVVPQPEKCEGDICSAKSLVAITLILEKAGTRVANYVQAETVSFEGFSKSESQTFVGFKAYESVLKNLQKLTDSSNITK